jgi:hypothetical protein
MDIFGQMKAKFKLAHKAATDEGQNHAGNTGNVLHELDDGQYHAGKYGKCPS